MLSKMYYGLIRKAITQEPEQNQYSGGLWPRLVREAALKALANATGRIVELGCGEGMLLEKIARDNPAAEICGIDSWPDIIEKARLRLAEHKNITLLYANALKTCLEGASFDHCVCVNTVQNLISLDEVRRLIQEARRVLKPGGAFIFDSRNALSPIIALQYRFVGWYDPGISVPLKAYRAVVIEQLLTDNGFRVKDKRFLGFPANKFAPAILFVAEKK